MAIGWRTRFATVVLWIVVLSIQARNNHANSGADTLLRMSLFWGMFLPLGARWSLDRYLARSPDASAQAAPRIVANLVSFGLLLQIACVYFFTAMLKDGPEWRTDSTAVYYALGIADISNPLGNWLFQTAPAWLLRGATMGTLWVEFAVPLMLIVPTRTGWLRSVAVFLVIALHVSIAATMWVGLFGAIAIASVVALLPCQFWTFIGARKRLNKPAKAIASQLRKFLDSLVRGQPQLQHSYNSPHSRPIKGTLNFRYAVLPDTEAVAKTALTVSVPSASS